MQPAVLKVERVTARSPAVRDDDTIGVAVGHIQLGDAVKVRVDSDPGKDFPGVIEQIARAAEFTPRNVQTVGERIKQVFGIKVRLDNSEGKLRAGVAADVRFPKVLK